MRKFFIALIAIVAYGTTLNAQVIFQQDFEFLEKGEDILNLKRGKFNTWGKSTWTVTEEAGKGYNNSNKFATSGGEENATLVQYKELEPGEKYEFTVAVKMDGTGGANWKGNYSVKVSSGSKDKTHSYGKEEIKEPKEGEWTLHTISFKVKKGKTNVSFQVYRWKPDVYISVDNFKLVKK